MAITAELRQVIEKREPLELQEAQDLARRLLAGEASEVETAALLGAMAARGETAEEIAGFALAMREAATMLPLTEAEREKVVDSCGTGGDGSGTINISTGAALVAAAAGAKVAKHGNRAVTSLCGSADVLEALGIPIGLEPAVAVDAIRQHGFCFLLASQHHPAMRAMMPVRRKLGVRTIFNVLGPLLNPAGARRQVMGVYSQAAMKSVAEAMPRLGVRHALVLHGAGGLDELSLSGVSEAIEVGADGLRSFQVRPELCGVATAPLAALAGGRNAAENAGLLQRVFAGEPGPRRDVILLNAAAVLLVAGRVQNIPDGVEMAAMAVDSGAVTALVAKLSGKS